MKPTTYESFDVTDQSTPPELYPISYDDFLQNSRALAVRVKESGWMPDFIIGVGRGGLVPGVYISHQLELPMLSIDHSAKLPDFAEELLQKVAVKSATGRRLLFVDDINDSGGTINYLRDCLNAAGCGAHNLRYAVLINNTNSHAKVDYWAETIDRRDDKRWFVFPWETVGKQEAILAEAMSVPDRLNPAAPLFS